MKKLITLIFVFAVGSMAAAPVNPVVPVDKVVVEKSIKEDSSKIVLYDTLVAIKYDTIKVSKTFRDTVKLIKADTVKTGKIDTIWTKKYSRGGK
jgi:hypothetical protein